MMRWEGPKEVWNGLLAARNERDLLRDSIRRMVEDGHPCGSPAADDWFRIMCERLRQVAPDDEAPITPIMSGEE